MFESGPERAAFGARSPKDEVFLTYGVPEVRMHFGVDNRALGVNNSQNIVDRV